MNRYAFSLILGTLVMILMGCEEYEFEDRINPYDPENPWGRKVISVIPLTTDGTSEYPSWSPDETKIAYYNAADRSIYVMDAAGGSVEKLPLLLDHTWENGPRWSPTEDKIAYIYNWDIFIRDYPGTDADPVQLTEEGECKPGSIVWSDDGTKIAYIQSGTAKIMDADGGNKKELESGELIETVSVISDWSPDGNKLLVISAKEPKAYTIDIRTDHVQLLPTGEEELCFYAVWSTDGSRVLYITFNHGRYELWIMNTDGSQKAAILTEDISPYANFIGSMSWSKDESAVLFVGSDLFYGPKRYICVMRMQLR